ncbi:hypothetical protein ACJJJB_01370 [Microbulbifer sp. ANSA001]|uniref:hypothetical protein n=1 Tax=Microbulbifer sp. ANSA001 TaxID=3243358 RepID=UPI004042617F
MSDNGESISKVFREPVLVELQDSVKKVRSNVVLVSFISLIMTFGGVKIDPESTFFGLKFTGLSNDHIYNGLLIIIIYFLFNFLWSMYEAFQEWEVRVTGIKMAYGSKGTSQDAYEENYPSDPRNASLYHWWSTQAEKIGSIEEEVLSAIESKAKIEEAIYKLKKEGVELTRDAENIPALLHRNNTKWDSIQSSIRVIHKAISADNISGPLKVFDRRYRYFLHAQNMRRLVFDFLFPSFLAAYAIFMLISS